MQRIANVTVGEPTPQVKPICSHTDDMFSHVPTGLEE